MSNFGFISKRKVAREIAKIYNDHNNTPCPKEQFMRDCEAQSALNLLCKKLRIIDWYFDKHKDEDAKDKCHGCFGAANNDCERCMDGNKK